MSYIGSEIFGVITYKVIGTSEIDIIIIFRKNFFVCKIYSSDLQTLSDLVVDRSSGEFPCTFKLLVGSIPISQRTILAEYKSPIPERYVIQASANPDSFYVADMPLTNYPSFITL